MLCPEVWNFLPPNSLIETDHGDFDRNPKPFKIIQNHYFNHLVSVVLPDTGISNAELIKNSIQTDSQYYKIISVPLYEFINDVFVESFMKKGKFHAISIQTKIDTDDCVAVTPGRKLVLSLNKETFQTLGLEGKLSFFCKKSKDRYIVNIDLNEENLKPGSKRYDRIKGCLTENFKNLTYIFSWIPHDKSVCPSSPAKYFDSRGYDVAICDIQITQRLDYNVEVPITGSEKDSVQELVDWLGVYSVAYVDQEDGNAYLSTYDYSGMCQKFGQTTFFSFAGFFAPEQILKLLETLRKYVASRSSLPWASLHVQGFDDTPVSWGLKEHQYNTNGDNSYTLFIQQDNRYLSHLLLGSNKQPK